MKTRKISDRIYDHRSHHEIQYDNIMTHPLRYHVIDTGVFKEPLIPLNSMSFNILSPYDQAVYYRN